MDARVGQADLRDINIMLSLLFLWSRVNITGVCNFRNVTLYNETADFYANSNFSECN